ncbi:MAG TPA: helix-turn-helix transcriptional regulator [Thermoanaerobaculia bacterium]
MEDLTSSTQEGLDPEFIEKYRRFIRESRASVDYWVGLPIVEFTEDVCRLMEEQNVSRAELARRLGTSRAYVTKLLGGNANFTLHTMTKVAMALGSAVHVHVADQNMVTRWRDKPSSRRSIADDSPAKPKRRKKARKPH